MKLCKDCDSYAGFADGEGEHLCRSVPAAMAEESVVTGLTYCRKNRVAGGSCDTFAKLFWPRRWWQFWKRP
jgi:hypothetical protein